MKVVHLSTYDSGGASIAAIRLHQSLMNKGIESHFFCGYGDKNYLPNYHIESPVKVSSLYRILNKLGWSITQNQKYWRRIKSLGGSYELATLPFQDADFSQHPLIQNADIIHFHFISYFIDIPSFFKKVKKPIVWTLHDMNPFLGCFHYLGDQESNKASFSELDAELIEIKTKAYATHERLKIVTPSKWLKEFSVKSGVFIGKEHLQIYNCINTNTFRYQNKAEMRRKHNLSEDKFLLLFVSQNINSYRKGFDLLIAAIKQLKSDNYELICIGNYSDDLGKVSNCKQLGVIKEEEKLADIYASADVFVLPSREDNLPNTMLESLCCGTPVIAFASGGMKDEIESGENGVLIETTNSASLLSAIEQVISHEYQFNAEEISKQAREKYNPDKQVDKYIEVYKSFKTKAVI